jgi:flagellar protein FliS
MKDPRTAYREDDARGATGVRLVVLLYEQLIKDLREAAKAMDENKIELRSKRINHAFEVICALQGTLNMERGGQVARNLAWFYTVLRANLLEAHFHQSQEMLSRRITDLLALREAWIEVDRAENQQAQTGNLSMETRCSA